MFENKNHVIIISSVIDHSLQCILNQTSISQQTQIETETMEKKKLQLKTEVELKALSIYLCFAA